MVKAQVLDGKPNDWRDWDLPNRCIVASGQARTPPPPTPPRPPRRAPLPCAAPHARAAARCSGVIGSIAELHRSHRQCLDHHSRRTRAQRRGAAA